MSTLEPGSVVADRYEILSLIKAGGMGAVYQARDVRGGPVVALKEMLQAFSFHADRALIYRKFEEEARLLQSLNHPNIPRVLAHFAKDDLYYIVMEYIEGESLEQLLDDYLTLTRKPIPAQLVVECALLLCPILTYLHTRQPRPIVHRDIKPGNIILRSHRDRMEIVLVDFGLARDVSGQNTQSPKTMVGTLGYAAMEQLRGLPEPRSDLYGLGVTMHHLLSGKAPRLFELPPLDSVTRELPPELLALVARATQEDTEQRFHSAAEMEMALARVLSLYKPGQERLSLARTLVRPQRDGRLSRTGRMQVPPMPGGSSTGRIPTPEALAVPQEDLPTIPAPWHAGPPHLPSAPSLPSPVREPPPPERRRRASDRRQGLLKGALLLGGLLTFAGGLTAGLYWGRSTPPASVAPPSPAVTLLPSARPTSTSVFVQPATAVPVPAAPVGLAGWTCVQAEGVTASPVGSLVLNAGSAPGRVSFQPSGVPAARISFTVAADSGTPPFVAWLGNCGVVMLPRQTKLSGVPQVAVLQGDDLDRVPLDALGHDVTAWNAYLHTEGDQDLQDITVLLESASPGTVALTVQRQGADLVREEGRLTTPWQPATLGFRVLGQASMDLHLLDVQQR